MTQTTVEALRIGIVEDEWIVARDLQRILEGAGYLVPFVSSSEPDARTQIARVPVDLVLMDIRLGQSADGIALVEQLRGSRRVPVVYVSAHGDARTLARARDTEPLGFIVKPFTDAQVRATVEVALASRGELESAPSSRTPDASLRVVAAALGRVDLPMRDELPRVADPEVARALATLSEREWEVLRGLLAHRKVPGIARKLCISQHTVRNHLKAIFSKLDVHSQEQLFDLLIRNVRTHEGMDDDG